jgi:hypothetical protein
MAQIKKLELKNYNERQKEIPEDEKSPDKN